MTQNPKLTNDPSICPYCKEPLPYIRIPCPDGEKEVAPGVYLGCLVIHYGYGKCKNKCEYKIEN